MPKENRPGFYFYTGDWRKDPAVQSLDYETRGVWFEMLLFMDQSEQRGKLILNGSAIPDEDLAVMLGLDQAKFKQILAKLLSKNVANREQNTDAIVNRRMMKDALKNKHLQTVRAEAGRKGGSKSQAKAKQKSQAKQALSSSSSLSLSYKDKALPVDKSKKTGINSEIKVVADRIYQSNPTKFARLIQWIKTAQKDGRKDSTIAETLRLFEGHKDNASNWWGYLTDMLSKASANVAGAESETYKRGDLTQVGAILNKIAGKVE